MNRTLITSLALLAAVLTGMFTPAQGQPQLTSLGEYLPDGAEVLKLVWPDVDMNGAESKERCQYDEVA